MVFDKKKIYDVVIMGFIIVEWNVFGSFVYLMLVYFNSW